VVMCHSRRSPGSCAPQGRARTTPRWHDQNPLAQPCEDVEHGPGGCRLGRCLFCACAGGRLLLTGQEQERLAGRLPGPWAKLRYRWLRGPKGGLLSCSCASSPNGVRTRVSTLRGWCPSPLDDGAKPEAV